MKTIVLILLMFDAGTGSLIDVQTVETQGEEHCMILGNAVTQHLNEAYVDQAFAYTCRELTPFSPAE